MKLFLITVDCMFAATRRQTWAVPGADMADALAYFNETVRPSNDEQVETITAVNARFLPRGEK